MSPRFFEPWPDFEESTAPFRKLYDRVTARLRLRQLALPGECERAWIDSLIRGFDWEFQSWEHNPGLRPYLELTGESSGESPALRVIGHAYLHVCFDLPRVIARSLDEIPIGRRRAQQIYRELGPDFAAVFKDAIPDPDIFGGYARAWAAAARILPQRKASALAGLLGNWLLTRRAEAWINALELRDSPDRPHLDAWMIGQIERTARTVMELSDDPIEWLNRLDSPILPGPYPAPMAEIVHASPLTCQPE